MQASLSFQRLSFSFPDVWKYGMLALSILLLLVALLILICQLSRCWKTNRFERERKFANEAWKGIAPENGFQRERLQTSLLGFVRQPYYEFKMQKIRKDLKKFEICFSPSSPSSSDGDILASESDVPDRTQGRLRFSFLYHKKRPELLLTVTGALGLPIQECTNIFVQARLLSWASSQAPDFRQVVQEWQTQVVKSSSGPTFGDQFVCPLQEAELTKSSIKLEVKHFDKYSRHISLGEVRVALNALNTSQHVEFCEDLQKVTKDTVGEVLVSLKCLSISQRIEVGLLKFKTASFYDCLEKRIYARIDVFCNLHKQKHQKSKTKSLASMTVFNETFLFHLPEPDVWDCAVLISIYEMHPSNRPLFGQAVLGKRGPSNNNNHWDRMMQTIQQPVAEWHPLLI